MIGINKASRPSDAQIQKQLVSNHLLTKDQIHFALQIARQQNISLSRVLLKEPELTPDRTLAAIAKAYNLPSVDLRGKTISHYVLELIPKQIAEEHATLIFKKSGDEIHVATADPHNEQAIEFIKKKTGFSVIVFVTTEESLLDALKKYKSDIGEEFSRIIQDGIKQTQAIHDTEEKMAQFVPIIRIVDTLIERALLKNASDVHVESATHNVVIRYRIDGLLEKIVELPKELFPPLITRIKILSQLKIDEHRLPQDGRMNFHFKGRDIAIRISSIPTLHGGKVVLRLLDTQKQIFTLRALGLNEFHLKQIKNEIKNQQGIILVTGPTGSGKTTTLYTLLRILNKEVQNICTVEDPIEYGLEGVNQTQINASAGLTFAKGLRSLLRQDPNILMVGEIRDRETAEIAFHASMTGHLVLSTLHTNNSFLAAQRLIEMGVEPFLVASVTSMIVSQRLVRRICQKCKTTERSSPKILQTFRQKMELDAVVAKLKNKKLLSTSFDLEHAKFYFGQGCDACGGTGYRSRIGIYEVLDIDDAISRTILQTPSAEAIKHAALHRGTITLKEDGILKVFHGYTTFEELVRVTQE